MLEISWLQKISSYDNKLPHWRSHEPRRSRWLSLEWGMPVAEEEVLPVARYRGLAAPPRIDNTPAARYRGLVVTPRKGNSSRKIQGATSLFGEVVC